MKAKYFLVIAAIVMMIGYGMHLTLCVHPNKIGLLIWNTIAHLFIWMSIFFASLYVLKKEVKKSIIMPAVDIEKEINELAASNESIAEFRAIIMITRIIIICSSRNFVSLVNLIIYLGIAYLNYRVTGQFSIFYVMISISFFLNKYFVMRCYGDEMDNKKKESEIDLQIFLEVKKMKTIAKKKWMRKL
jgi:hypothetical protein